MQLEVSDTTRELIRQLTHTDRSALRLNKAVAAAALMRAAAFFGDLHAPTGNLWDARDSHDNYVLGKFTYNTAAGLLAGTTLEQHGALEHHARTILGVLDDQTVVDRLDQVLNGRPISLMGYVSGGTSRNGQIAFQLDPDLMYQAAPESDRIYQAVSECAQTLIEAGFDPHKPTAFHAEINNRWGFSAARKAEYDLLKSIGVPENELPRYRSHVYITMPETLALNEDLVTEELQLHDLAHWA